MASGTIVTSGTLKIIRGFLETSFLRHDEIAEKCQCSPSTVARYKRAYSIQRPKGYAQHAQKYRRTLTERADYKTRDYVKRPNEEKINKIFAGCRFENYSIPSTLPLVAVQ